MNTWLITGGAGFIGTNFVHRLAREPGVSIVVLDALTYAGNINNLSALVDTNRIDFVHGDIRDDSLVRSLFERYEFERVVHLAAESHVDRSILEPSDFITTNVQGTYVLLEAARMAWKDNAIDKRFVHVSTDEVFGDLGLDDKPFDESTPYNPSSPYSASKAASDHLARAWFRTYRLPVIVTNCSNNFGPWQFPEKFIPLMITNAIHRQALPVYGDGLQRRDWLHVADHCDALTLVAKQGKPGETYSIGGGCEMANIDVLDLICRTVDTKLKRSPGESAAQLEYVADRPGHDRRYAIDSSYLARALGWRARHSFSDSLSAIVDWYIEHDVWVENIRSGAYRNYYDEQYTDRAKRDTPR